MSVFQVKLNNNKQGVLDTDSLTGLELQTSIQRQIFVAGPKRKYRLLVDGATFTDCNYWKRFTAEEIGAEQSFIVVLSDDGSVYSDVPEENTFAVGDTVTVTTDYDDTVVDFVGDNGGPARFLSVQNLDESISIFGQINGNANVTFKLLGGETMMFNQGDLIITSLKLKSASSTVDVSYLASVRSNPTS